MAKIYGKTFSSDVYDPAVGKINEFIGITLNGRFVMDKDLLATELKEGDRVAFFILVAGG
jgi:molybdopterin converting factor small subunit